VSSITIGEARRTGVRASPILSFPLCCTNTIDAAIRTPLIGELAKRGEYEKSAKNLTIAIRLKSSDIIQTLFALVINKQVAILRF
jgi:hypothetical protein